MRVKRSGKHDFRSIDVERYVGGGLNQHADTAGVNVHKPDVYVDLEIRNESLYVVTNILQRSRWFPARHTRFHAYRLSRVVLTLLLQVICRCDVAVKLISYFFNLGGHAHEIGVKQVVAVSVAKVWFFCAREIYHDPF